MQTYKHPKRIINKPPLNVSPAKLLAPCYVNMVPYDRPSDGVSNRSFFLSAEFGAPIS